MARNKNRDRQAERRPEPEPPRPDAPVEQPRGKKRERRFGHN
ncbi:hypothetical protein [Streptomyces marincola]|nr:hypothetical protein [Streptomyces marincola]